MCVFLLKCPVAIEAPSIKLSVGNTAAGFGLKTKGVSQKYTTDYKIKLKFKGPDIPVFIECKELCNSTYFKVKLDERADLNANATMLAV